MKRLLTLSFVGLACAGLIIWTGGQASEASFTAQKVTFNKDVAPIFYKSCAECHRPGEAAPFSVLTYKDARPWAKSIREKVISREMPPWHADPHIGQWANNPSLTQKEIDTIVAWIDSGANEGNPKDLPTAPTFADGWNIGKPDVVIEMPEPYKLAASGPDEYQYFDVPTNFTEDKYIQMAEARPGNRRIVHHIIAFVVPPGSPNLAKIPKEQRDKALEMSLRNSPFYRDGYLIRVKPDQPVYNDGNDVPVNLRGENNVDDFLTAYAPGSTYGIWQPGTAKKVPAGATIRFQVHYSKVAGSEQQDKSMVGLVFAKEQPQRVLKTRGPSNIYFKIPPGAENHLATAVWNLKSDIVVYSLLPHMHYRGKAIEYTVTYPNGKKETLLRVPTYSFSWQMSYDPKQPIHIPAGSKIEVTGYFDNSASNKFNPDPTQAVRYGEPTYDEMLIGFMDYVAVKPKTLAKIDNQKFDAFIGKYDFGRNVSYQLTREGDRYFGQAPNNPKRELFPIGDLKFAIPEVESLVTLQKNDKGEMELVYEQSERVLHCPRIKDTAADVSQK